MNSHESGSVWTMRAVAGALRSTITAHGPITNETINSAAKRIIGQVTKGDVGQDGRTRGASPAVLPSGSYRTIVADPPWHYDEFGTSPTSRKDTPRGDGKRAPKPLPYASLSVAEIAALPVGALAGSHAALFLWTTSRYLPDAPDVMESWGFDYRQTLVWHKTGNPSPFGGSVAPNHAEFLLVGRRGKPTLGRLPSSVIAAPAPNCGHHSAKPECFIDHIESIAEAPYVELFARRDRLGWDTWGNESLGTAEVAA